MKKLTTLIFSATIAPALALSTAAFAEERGDNALGDKQRADEQQAADQRNEDMTGSEQRVGEERNDNALGDKQRDDQERASGQQAGEQLAGEQRMSGKPAGAFYADDVIGETLKHRGSDEDIGEIQDLVIGEDGRVVGVVVTTGGFLGLGGQDISLDWDQIEHTMEEDESVFYTDMDEEALRNAPEHERE